MAEGVPPGRAGRLWLENRLGHGRRALDLLDRKRRILRARLGEAAAARDRAAAGWRRAASDAYRAAVTAQALAGAWAVDTAAGPARGRARVVVGEDEAVGVRHPAQALVDVPDLPAAHAVAFGPAVTGAAAAHRDALVSAVELAVAERTFELLEAELSVTERRYRAIERIRLPALEQQLQVLNLRLDEIERQERVGTRWAADRAGPTGRPRPGGA